MANVCMKRYIKIVIAIILVVLLFLALIFSNIFYNSKIFHALLYSDSDSYYDISVYGNGMIEYTEGVRHRYWDEDYAKQYKMDSATSELYAEKGTKQLSFGDRCNILWKMFLLQFVIREHYGVMGFVDRAEVTVFGKRYLIEAIEFPAADDGDLSRILTGEIVDILRMYADIPPNLAY